MMKVLIKYEYLLPLVVSVLLFLTLRDSFSSLLYTVIVAIAGVYFFPLRDFVLGDDLQWKEKNIDFIGLLASFFLSVILAISVPFLYLSENESIKLIIKILALINFAFLVYFYFKDQDNKRSILHFCFTFFTAVLMV